MQLKVKKQSSGYKIAYTYPLHWKARKWQKINLRTYEVTHFLERNVKNLKRLQVEIGEPRISNHQGIRIGLKIASSRRSVSQGAVYKTVREKIKKARQDSSRRAIFIFSRAVLRCTLTN